MILKMIFNINKKLPIGNKLGKILVGLEQPLLKHSVTKIKYTNMKLKLKNFTNLQNLFIRNIIITLNKIYIQHPLNCIN